MTVPYVLIQEATGDIPVTAPPIDSICAYLGTSSTGTALTPRFLGRAEALATLYGEGPGVRACGHALRKTKRPQVFCRVANGDDGEYGTVDDSLVTGTATVDVDATSLPLNDYEAALEVTVGGTLGVAGIRFKWSVTSLRNLSPTTNLGTAYSYTLPGTGVKFTFEPPTDALVAIAVELRTDLLAHFNDGTTVHDDDDASAVALITLSAPTTNTEAIAVINECRAAYVLHRNTGAPVHNSADVMAGSAVAAPVAVTGQEAITLAIDLKAKINVHMGNATAHNAADTTNTITTAAPSRGTLVKGDKVYVSTIGPKWDTDGLAAAFNKLAESNLDFAMVYVAGPCSATEADTVKSGLDILKGVGKRCAALLNARPQDVGEDEADWIDALVDDWATFVDDRIGVCAGTARVTVNEASTGVARQYNTTFAFALMARLIGIDRFVSPGWFDLGALDGVVIYDGSGARIGHDEAWIGGLDEGRFIALHRPADPDRRDGAYISHPFVMKDEATGRVSEFQVRRVLNAAERVAASVGFGDIALQAVYDPDTQTISEQAASALAAKIRGPLSSEFDDDISNPKDENLVTVSQTVTVDGDQVFLEVTVSMVPLKYIGGITITFSLRV